jgi:hypothetical protein
MGGGIAALVACRRRHEHEGSQAKAPGEVRAAGSRRVSGGDGAAKLGCATRILQWLLCSSESQRPSSGLTALGRRGGDEGQDQPHGRASKVALTGEGLLRRCSASKPARGRFFGD